MVDECGLNSFFCFFPISIDDLTRNESSAAYLFATNSLTDIMHPIYHHRTVGRGYHAVMNAQSSKRTDLAKLKFYVVPAAACKAYSVLTAQTV
jgi:hypothetical protein